ncbi:MAG: hypothetical protein WCB49_02920 [Gammaproteobacteria bacterium]
MIDWFEIYVQDMERTRAFYEKEKFPIAKYGFIALAFDTEDNLIGLHSMY